MSGKFEIEAKAWADEPEKLRSIIDALGSFVGAFDKEDAYWHGDAFAQGIRVRKERKTDAQGRQSAVVWATYKAKEARDGIEINDEREFSVSDAENFEDFLKKLGLAPLIAKRKRGWAWNYEGITVELAEIKTLGWFIEQEIMADNAETETVNAAKNRLLRFLRQVGINEDKIEARYYAEMLAQNSASSRQR
jgi:adenylate cyclase class 2